MLTQRILTAPFANYLFLRQQCTPKRECAIGDLQITNDSSTADLIEAVELPLLPCGVTVLIKSGCAQMALFTRQLSYRLQNPVIEKLWKHGTGCKPWSLRIFWDEPLQREGFKIDWWN